MKIKILILVLSLYPFLKLFAQTVKIVKGDVTNIHPLYDSTKRALKKSDTIHIRVHITGDYSATAAVIVFDLNEGTFPNTPLFTNGTKSYTYTISTVEWANALAEADNNLQIILNITCQSLETALKYDEFGQIVIHDQLEIHSLRLTDIGTYTAKKNFWIELGANFDINTGFKPINLYAGIFLYNKDVAKFYGKKNISILGGVYESRSLTNNLSSDNGFTYRDGKSYINASGSGYPIFRDTGIIDAVVTATNLGLFFSPQIRLTNGSAESEGIHVFISLWAELLWQRIQTDFNYTNLHEVAGNLTTTYVQTLEEVGKYDVKNSKSIQDYRSHYFGLGLPIYLKEGDANLYINPIFWGLTTQKFTPLPDINMDGKTIIPSVKEWNSFYLIQFRLSEEKYGFTFTGEIRGLYGVKNKPIISLALSKKIDLQRIGEYVGKIMKY